MGLVLTLYGIIGTEWRCVTCNATMPGAVQPDVVEAFPT